LGITPLTLNVELPDPSDLPFLEVAATAGAALITGNRRHYPEEILHKHDIHVFSPKEYLIHWQE
jgi:predicted nucleic acid-binding protein